MSPPTLPRTSSSCAAHQRVGFFFCPLRSSSRRLRRRRKVVVANTSPDFFVGAAAPSSSSNGLSKSVGIQRCLLVDFDDTDGSHHHHHRHHRKTVVAFSSFSSKTPETHENDEDNDGNVNAAAGKRFVEEDETRILRAKIGPLRDRVKALRRPTTTNHHHHRTTTTTEEEEEEEEEETAPFSWEDIVRASVTTLEEVFSNEGDDDDDGREKEENEKKLTVGIVKGAETADADDERETRTTFRSNTSSDTSDAESESEKEKKSNDNDNNNRWEWQRQFDNPFQFMGHFKKAPAAEKGKEKNITTTAAESPPLSPIVKKTMKEEKDATSAGANWIPDARAFLMHLPLPPLVGNLFSGSSSTTTTTTTTTADLSTSDQDEELNVGDDKRIIDERLRDANVNAVAVAINSLQNLTAAIQEIDLQINRESPPRTPRSPSPPTTATTIPPTTLTAKEYGTFVTPENGKSEEDTFNDLKEALAEAIKNAEKAKAKLEDVKIAANDVLKVRERIENYSESATYKKNVSWTSSQNGKAALSETQPENIQALRQALEAAQVKLKEASISSRKQTIVVGRQILVLRELFEPGAQKSATSSVTGADTNNQREQRQDQRLLQDHHQQQQQQQQQEELEEMKRIDEVLYGKINSARKIAEDAIVATNITETLAKLMWPGEKISQMVTRQLKEIASIDEDAENLIDASTTDETARSDNLDSILQPALRNMVSSSLYRVSEEDTKNARIACSLSSWIYNFPDQTTQDGLTRNGLTMLWNSHEHKEALSEDEINGNDNQQRQLVDLTTSDVGITNPDDDDADSSEKNNAILLENLKKERHNREESIRLASAAADEAIKALASVKRMRELKPGDPNAAEAAKKATEIANLVSQELTRVSETQKTLRKERSALLRERENISKLQRAKLNASSEDGHQKKKKNGNNKDSGENTVMPVNYCVCEDKQNATLWIVIEGSTNWASWQTNLTWTPTAFEDKEINVHQGAYACAQRMYDRVEKLCKNHLKTFGSKKARIKLTGHSIGGSLAYVLGLMLILRNGVPRYALDDIWTFGSPYVFDRGAEDLMQRIGLQRDFIKGVIMGKDIVPRSFSCYYPPWTRSILSSAPAPFKCVNMPTLLNEEMMYAPLGDMYLLQAVHGSAHPLLPEGPGFYKLQGEEMYDIIAAKARESTSTMIPDGSFDEESHWLDVQKDEHKLDFYADEASALESDEDERGEAQSRGKATTTKKKEKTLSENLNKIACLTQADAALTASLIISQIDRELLTKTKESVGGLSVIMREQTRDAAQRVILNTPHPLTVLSDPGSYGSQGSISRHHNPYSYQKALSRAAKASQGNKEDSFFF